jgi:transcriptional regulator with XRE-family HTH domain
MVNLGDRLKKSRNNIHLTQNQVAERIGKTKAAISSYELNIREPDLTTLMKLAALYKVSVDSLLGLEKGEYLEVSGLSPKQISIIQSIIDSYRER